MEPKRERPGADESGKRSGSSTEDDDEPSIVVPAVPNLPEPPTVNYSRPPLKRGVYAARSVDEHVGVSDEQNKVNVAARMGSGLSAGITFASSVTVSVLVGMWLDRHFEPHSTTPWATIVMSLLGFAAGFVTFVRITNIADQNIKRRR